MDISLKLYYFNGMNILLTNDDGYNAIGILLLQKKLSKYGRVVIVAPSKGMSAKSVAITLGTPLKVSKVEDDVYKVEGTPADCVSFALSSLDIKFDVVVSGCNAGLNVSYDTVYSGTIGAGIEALTYEVPAIAFSCDKNYDIVEHFFEKVMDFILSNKLLSNHYLLNVNFPLGEEVKDIVFTDIYYRKENAYFVHQGNDDYLALRDIHDENCEEKDTDVYAVYHQMVSISKLNRTF